MRPFPVSMKSSTIAVLLAIFVDDDNKPYLYYFQAVIRTYLKRSVEFRFDDAERISPTAFFN
jgi:hypothetical protein